jgi:hypothetical protein
LVIFDLLTKPDVVLTKQEVKKAARKLLAVLKREKLVLDWKKQQTTRAAVWQAIDGISLVGTDLQAPAHDQRMENAAPTMPESNDEQNT